MEWQKWITDKAKEEGYEVVAEKAGLSPRLVYYLARGDRPFTWETKLLLAQAYPELRVFVAVEMGKRAGIT